MIKNTTNNRCSRHPDSDALTYCGACNKYMCAECKTHHDELFGREHEASVVPSERVAEDTEDQYNEKCKAHPEYPLETMCNDCNCLCCAKCKLEGEHKGHNTVPIDGAQDALKASLESYIPSLERYQSSFEEVHQKAEELVNNAEVKTSETAELIRQSFKTLREAIDKKEYEILGRLESYEANQETASSLINDARDLMDEVPTIIEGVKKLLAEWDSKKLTAGTAGKVLAIKGKVESGEKIADELKRVGGCETLVETEWFLKGVKCVLEEINGVEEVPVKKVMCSAPTGFGTKAVHPLFVSLCWDKNEEFDEYIFSKREEGGEWSYGKDLIHVVNEKGKMNQFVLYPLEPDTVYEFRMMGKKEGIETRWSEAVSVRTGARTVIHDVDNAVFNLKRNMNNTEACVRLFRLFSDLARTSDDHIKALGEAGAIELIAKAMTMHINNVEIYKNGCGAFWNITIINNDNRVIAGHAGVIDAIVKAMNTHINNTELCENSCAVLMDFINNAANQIRAAKAGVIDAVLKVMSTHSDKVEICKIGCIILCNFSEGNSSIQEEICEKGGLPILLKLLKKYENDNYLLVLCCGAIGKILSSEETHSKYCTPDVLDAVRRCSEKHKDMEEIKQFLLGLTREEDPRVRDSVSRGVCTKDAFPKCSERCRSDENAYCPKCCVQQKAFRCLTCDRDEIRYYCETCWKRDHQGHECEEFFYPVRCGTK